MSWRLPRYAVFVSGRGSNLAALIDQATQIEIGLVVSDKVSALALCKAKRAGIPTLILKKPIDWAELTLTLKAHQIDIIFLAGFMRIIPAEFVNDWQGRILNVHPSLLPLYPGLNSIKKAFQDGASLGVTVHEVIPEMDAGPIILQRKIDDIPNKIANLDEAEFFTHLCEHRLVREAARLCSKKLK